MRLHRGRVVVNRFAKYAKFSFTAPMFVRGPLSSGP